LLSHRYFMKIGITFLSIVVLYTLLPGCKSGSTNPPNVAKPILEFSSDTINFGTVTSGASKSQNLSITNFGTASITIQSVNPNSSASPYSVTGVPVTIAPNSSKTIVVMLTSTTVGAYVEKFNVATDADSVFHFYAQDTVASYVNDPVVYSFVVFGCNRVAKGDFSTTANPSSANLPQLNRTFADIAALTPKPDFIFDMGDLVVGEADSLSLANELIAWEALYEASPAKAAGIELVAITGNHETEDGNGTPQLSAEQAWLSIMAPYTTRGGNGPVPHAGDPDALQSDQSKLTYSFNFKDAHFVVISTDPAGQDSHPPGNWLANDITTAHANSSIKHIFAFGHKPAYSYNGSTSNSLGAYPSNLSLFWNAMETSKAEAMFAAHNHTYRAFRPDGKSWMVISGNAGSALETTAPLFYGFTLVQVLQSGTVVEKNYGRNFGALYNGLSDPATYPTTLRDSNVISWK